MKILVVAATRGEIEASIPFLETHNISYLITGVGMLATTYALTKRLTEQTADLIINVGVGGILDPNAQLGEVYQIVSDSIHAFGAEDHEDFIPIDRLGFGKSLFLERSPALPLANHKLKKAYGITVNKVHGNAASIAKLRTQHPPNTIESMEGAAVFFIAEQLETSCLQFRAISNYIEPRDRENWALKEAVLQLNKALQSILNSFL